MTDYVIVVGKGYCETSGKGIALQISTKCQNGNLKNKNTFFYRWLGIYNNNQNIKISLKKIDPKLYTASII